MATFTGTKAQSTVMADAGISLTAAFNSYTTAAAPALNDVYKMFKIPKGATILNGVLTSDDFDSNGTPTIIFDVGDTGDTDRYIAASNIGQAGGVAAFNARTGINYTTTSEITMDILIKTGPATGVAVGTLQLNAIYKCAQ